MDNGDASLCRFLEGEKDAFDRVLEIYFDNLTFFINRYVHDIGTAEDLAIDTLLELIVHPKRFNFKVSLKTYLFTIGRNKAINYIRRRGRIAVTELTDNDVPSDYVSLEEELIRDEERQRVSRAIDRLPDDMRAAVHLVYFEELTYAEAAKVMKKSPKQVDNLLYRAKKVIKDLIENGDKL